MPEHQEILAPYPGLRSFEPHEATIFFGREDHVGRLLEILARERFLVVIGPSGSGKSSLVRAGLLPALTAGWAGTGSDWRVAIMRPGDRPMRSLALSLVEPDVLGAELDIGADSDAGRSATEVVVPLIEAELRRGPRGLQEIVAGARKRHTGAQPFDLLVLVDQFEEIFRYARASDRHADEADAFVRLLLEPRTDKEARLHVALTMRSDFLGNCVRFLELPDAINRAQYLTPRLDRAQLESVIVDPARVFGGDIEPELATELVNSVGTDSDQLPVLQHALARMWDRARGRSDASPIATRDDLAQIGGMAGALTSHANQLVGELSGEEVYLTEILFRAITERTTESGARDTRRPQRLQEIADAAQREWRAFVPIVDHFSREGVNFLTHGRPLGPDAVVDISHEALIRQWDRLQQWVIDESDRARAYQRLRQRALDHAAGQGDLLSGVDLPRATEWLNGQWGRQGPADANVGSAQPKHWKPTAAWAARYARADNGDPEAEFDSVVAYIARGQEAAREREKAIEDATRREREREQERHAAEKRDAEARAEMERLRAEGALRARKILAATAVLAVLASALATTLYLNAREAREVALAARAQAEVSADKETKAAAVARMESERAQEALGKLVVAEKEAQLARVRAEESAQREKDAAMMAQKQAEETKKALERLESTLRDKRSLEEQLAAAQALQFRASATAALTDSQVTVKTAPPAKPMAGRGLDDRGLTSLAPGLTPAQRSEILPHLRAAMDSFGIDTPMRQAAFLAQVAYESGGFLRLEENLSYSAQGLRSVFPGRFKAESDAQSYALQPEKIANRIYANRFGNGSEESGDGWRFHGRGAIQIVGRENYQYLGKAMGLDLEKNPDQAATYPVAYHIAAVFWQIKKLNELADQGDVRGITQRINGGLNGLNVREDLYAKAKAALGR